MRNAALNTSKCDVIRQKQPLVSLIVDWSQAADGRVLDLKPSFSFVPFLCMSSTFSGLVISTFMSTHAP